MIRHAATLASLVLLAPAVAAQEAPLVVEEVVHREDGIHLLITGPGASMLLPGAEGSFAEEARFGERVYRRTLARFVVLEAGPQGARARITARLEGWIPLPGALLAPGASAAGSSLPGPTRSLPLAPFEVVLAGGSEGAPDRLFVTLALVVPEERADAVARELERRTGDVRSAVLAVLLSLSQGDLARADVRETTAEVIRRKVDLLLPPDAAAPARETVLRIDFEEWRTGAR